MKQQKKIESYLDLVEDHRPDLENSQTVNLFQKVLVVSTRAKNLLPVFNSGNQNIFKAGYMALREFNQNKIIPDVREKEDNHENLDFEE